jgi:hypothetical protein
MTDETTPVPAADSAPAGDKPDPTTNLDAVQETPKVETKPETEPKTEAKADGSDTAAETDDDGEPKPKRPSTHQRHKRQVQYLSGRVAELEAALEGRSAPADRQRATESDDTKPPKEEDFKGDYLAFERALNAWNIEQAVDKGVQRKVDQARRDELRRQEAQARAEAIEAHTERMDEARGRITDFDQVMRSAGDVKVSPALADEILDSEKSALLQYYLAKNPDKVRELNSLSGRELAREIGRLEGRVHLPKPKTATGASPPLTQPTGGAAPAFNPETADMESYVRERRKQIEARHR